MAYLIDANVLIQAKNEHYGMDFCPGFWDWIDVGCENGVVASVLAVYDELREGDDELSEWSGLRRRVFFREPDDSVISAARGIVQWVTKQPFRSAAIIKFTDSADHALVAHALAKRMTVVTHERSSNSWRRVKIPDVCHQFNVNCINPFKMLRRERARFALERQP